MALAVCEFCGMVWALILVIGTVYLTGWCGWSGWTWLGTVMLIGIWTCRYCPGHAKYEAAKKDE